jgi:hypothetical protein
MEAIDQRKSIRMNHKSRSGNLKFESSLPLDSCEVSGKSEEEGAQDEEETSIFHPAPESHGRAPESPRATFCGRRRWSEKEMWS